MPPRKSSNKRPRNRAPSLRIVPETTQKFKYQLQPRQKLHDSAFVTTLSSISTAGTITFPVSDIPLGPDFYQREGSDVYVSNIHLDGYLQKGDDTNLLRLIVAVVDNSATISQLNFNLGDSIDTPTGRAKRLLFDRIFALDIYHQYQHVNVTIPVNQVFRFNSPTGTLLGDSLCVAAVSDSFAVPNPGFVSGHITIYFQDASQLIAGGGHF